MAQQSEEAKRLDRLFLIAFVPVIAFMLVSFYVRITGENDPLWSEFATPLFCTLLGVRALVMPAPPETRKVMRGVGIALLLITAALVTVIIVKSGPAA